MFRDRRLRNVSAAGGIVLTPPLPAIALERLSGAQVVAVLRRRRYGDPTALVGSLMSAGVTAIEFTFTGTDTAAAIATAKARYPDALVGAGTVQTPDELDRAIAAGADFAAAPILDESVVAQTRGRILFLPGVQTPSELARARELELGAVKLYPAFLGGPRYVRELTGMFPEVKLFATGGITPENAAEYLAAGAVAVGLGSALVGSPGAPAGAAELRARLAILAVGGHQQRANAPEKETDAS